MVYRGQQKLGCVQDTQCLDTPKLDDDNACVYIYISMYIIYMDNGDDNSWISLSLSLNNMAKPTMNKPISQAFVGNDKSSHF